jgi:hypothetical protein
MRGLRSLTNKGRETDDDENEDGEHPRGWKVDNRVFMWLEFGN